MDKKPILSTTRKGLLAEDEVLLHFQRQGWILLNRNYRWKRGELDLILFYKETLIFLEVRSGNVSNSLLRYSIQKAKRYHLRQTIAHYLRSAEWRNTRLGYKNIRVDCVWHWTDAHGCKKIEHWKNLYLD